MLYNNSAFPAPWKPIARLNTNVPPVYLFGALDTKTQPWLFEVTSVAVTSDVATVTGTLKSGGGPGPRTLPQVGAKMGVQGTQTNSGAFNVDPTAVTVVTFTPSTGAVSVSFPLTHADVATTADTGTLVIQPYEAPDLVSEGSASAPFALFYGPDESDNSRCAFAEAKWYGTIPTTATVVLEVANVDDDGFGASPVSRYNVAQNAYGTSDAGVVAQSDALATVAGSAVTQSGAQYTFLIGKFIRAKVLSMTGGDDTTGLVVTIFA